MQNLTKIVLAGALICLATVVAVGTSAEAGNMSVQLAGDEVRYFSERITFGERLVHGATGDASMLVDDITYRVNMTPDSSFLQGAHLRHFTLADLDTHLRCDPSFVFGVVPGPICAGAAGDTLFYSGAQPPGSLGIEVQRWTKSSSGQYGLHLAEIAVGVPDRPFDGISHNLYAQLMAAEEEHLNSDGSGSGVGIGVGMMGWLANTSESRHFQTPEIIEGLGVELRHPNNSPAIAPYNVDVEVFIRGRIVFDASRPVKAPATAVHVASTP